jgi:hypothetical protein
MKCPSELGMIGLMAVAGWLVAVVITIAVLALLGIGP